VLQHVVGARDSSLVQGFQTGFGERPSSDLMGAAILIFEFIKTALSTKSSNEYVTSCRSEGNVKCTLVQALRVCTGHTAHRGSRGIAVLYRH